VSTCREEARETKTLTRETRHSLERKHERQRHSQHSQQEARERRREREQSRERQRERESRARERERKKRERDRWTGSGTFSGCSGMGAETCGGDCIPIRKNKFCSLGERVLPRNDGHVARDRLPCNRRSIVGFQPVSSIRVRWPLKCSLGASISSVERSTHSTDYNGMDASHYIYGSS